VLARGAVHALAPPGQLGHLPAVLLAGAQRAHTLLVYQGRTGGVIICKVGQVVQLETAVVREELKEALEQITLSEGGEEGEANNAHAVATS